MPSPTPDGDPLVGLILAGGAGRRMGGVAKALLPYRGRQLVDVAVDALAPYTTDVLLSVGAFPDLAIRGLSRVFDRFPGAGPLAGLDAAFQARPSCRLLVLPCDVPEVRAAHLAPLLAAPPADVVVYGHGDPAAPRLEPLIGCYGPACAPAVAAALGQGIHKVRAIFSALRVTVLPFDGDPATFRNVNAPDDLTP